MLVKPLVIGVEGGDRDVDYLHFADGSMATAGLDEDGGVGLDRDPFAVEFHMAIAFEDEVYLGKFLVIVDFGVVPDVDHVHRGFGIVRADKAPA